MEINNQNHVAWTHPEQVARILHERGFWSTDDVSHVVFYGVGHEANVKEFIRVMKTATAVESMPDLYSEDSFESMYNDLMGPRRINTLASKELAEKILKQVGRHAVTTVEAFVAEVFVGRVVGKQYDDDIMALYKSLAGFPVW